MKLQFKSYMVRTCNPLKIEGNLPRQVYHRARFEKLRIGARHKHHSSPQPDPLSGNASRIYLIIQGSTPTSISGDTVTPLPGAQIGFHHSRPGPRSSAQVSGCGDKRAPKDSSASSPPASKSDPHPEAGKIAVSPRRAYLHYTQYLIHCWRNACFGYLAHFGRAPESLRWIPPLDLRLTFHSRRVVLRCGCQYGQATDRRSVFDILSPSHGHRYRA